MPGVANIGGCCCDGGGGEEPFCPDVAANITLRVTYWKAIATNASELRSDSWTLAYSPTFGYWLPDTGLYSYSPCTTLGTTGFSWFPGFGVGTVLSGVPNRWRMSITCVGEGEYTVALVGVIACSSPGTCNRWVLTMSEPASFAGSPFHATWDIQDGDWSIGGACNPVNVVWCAHEGGVLIDSGGLVGPHGIAAAPYLCGVRTVEVFET